MNKLRTIILSLLLTALTTQTASAVVSGGMALAGSAGAGKLALTALGSAGGGYLMGANQVACRGYGCIVPIYIGVGLGLILLDKEGTPTFSKLDVKNANTLELTQEEIKIYNSEIHEANLLLEEVSNEITEGMSIDDVRGIWHDYADFVSPETFQVMERITTK